jgi:methyltransferase-like protein
VTGYDRLTNQHFRPALLVIINNDSRDNITRWCDVDYATEAVLENLDASTWFDEQRSTWNQRGKEINNARELLLCYYESLRVVFIPSGEAVRTQIIFEQYQKLYAEVQAGAQQVQSRRRSAGVNPDIETLTLYTELAFQALSENLDGPVGFL